MDEFRGFREPNGMLTNDIGDSTAGEMEQEFADRDARLMVYLSQSRDGWWRAGHELEEIANKDLCKTEGSTFASYCESRNLELRTVYYWRRATRMINALMGYHAMTKLKKKEWVGTVPDDILDLMEGKQAFSPYTVDCLFEIVGASEGAINQIDRDLAKELLGELNPQWILEIGWTKLNRVYKRVMENLENGFDELRRASQLSRPDLETELEPPYEYKDEFSILQGLLSSSRSKARNKDLGLSLKQLVRLEQEIKMLIKRMADIGRYKKDVQSPTSPA